MPKPIEWKAPLTVADLEARGIPVPEPDEKGVIWVEDPEHDFHDGQEWRVFHYISDKAQCTVYKPVLSPEEYERRRKLLEEACVNLILSTEERKRKLNEQKNGVTAG